MKMKKHTLLVTIECGDYASDEEVSKALVNRLDGWDVGATVTIIDMEESLDLELASLNRKISDAKKKLSSLEDVREAVRKQIRDDQSRQGDK